MPAPISPLRPSDVLRIAAEYDASPDIADPALTELWESYAVFSIERQAELAGTFTIYLVTEEAPYNHGSELLADLVAGEYMVPAPHSAPVHPVWDGVAFGAARTWHDLSGHGAGGVGFTLAEEVRTFCLQAEELRTHGREELIPVVFSDTMQQLCSTLANHVFAPQKVTLTEYERLLDRCLAVGS